MQAYLKNIVINKSVRMLCVRPYSNHPKGCPNYGKRALCPPQVKTIDEIFSINKGFWVVWIDFNFSVHCKKMKRKHPHWTQRQIECCLYWQGTANKMLKEAVKNFLGSNDNWRPIFCPEAMGVNMTATMKKLGVELEWPPKNMVRKIALLGIKKKSHKTIVKTHKKMIRKDR